MPLELALALALPEPWSLLPAKVEVTFGADGTVAALAVKVDSSPGFSALALDFG